MSLEELWDLHELAVKEGMDDAARWMAARIPYAPGVPVGEYCINHGHIRLSADTHNCRNHMKSSYGCVFYRTPNAPEVVPL